LAYGDRFDGIEPSRDPAVFTRVQFGAMGTASIRNSLTQPLTRNEAVADFSVEYGMPGKRDYAYHHPFDYFDFQFASSTGSRFESIFTRGLLAGKAYGEGLHRSRGVWGLYGSYDYVAPHHIRERSAVRRRYAGAWIGRTVLHVSRRHAFRRRGVLKDTARGQRRVLRRSEADVCTGLVTSAAHRKLDASSRLPRPMYF